jgi:hypothetical protein
MILERKLVYLFKLILIVVICYVSLAVWIDFDE